MSLCYPSDTDWGCALSDEEIAALDPDLKEIAEGNAWYTLAALTAYQIATCPLTVRPCAVGCQGAGTRMTSIVRSQGMFAPQIDQNGSWVNVCGCAPSRDCSCSRPCEAILPGTVGQITEVLIDGIPLAPSSYRVDNGNRLVRTDGGCWPECQDMALDATTAVYEDQDFTWGTTGTVHLTRVGDHVEATITPDVSPSGALAYDERFWPDPGTQLTLFAGGLNIVVQNVAPPIADIQALTISNTAFPQDPVAYASWEGKSFPPSQIPNEGTFAVTYYQGAAPDALTRRAAGLLAVEFYKACTNKECKLPARVQTVTRQGVSYQVTSDMFADGSTGIHEVDALIGRYNPRHLISPPAISSPDLRRPRVPTWGR